MPKIEWFKDDMPLNSPDYQTSFVKGTATLTIEETFSEDTAKYTCRATTPEGSVDTTATLRVKGQCLRCACFVFFIEIFGTDYAHRLKKT